MLEHVYIDRKSMAPAGEGSDPKWNELLQITNERNMRVFWTKRIYDKKTGDELDGLYLGGTEGETVIFLKGSLKDEEANHVLAHEIGHALMHKGEGNTLQYRKEVRDRIELEAEVFALALTKLPDKCKDLGIDVIAESIKEVVRMEGAETQ